MIFYRYSFFKKQENKEVLSQENSEPAEDEVVLHENYCQTLMDGKLFIFVVSDRKAKIDVDAIFDKSLAEISLLDDAVDEFIKKLNKEAVLGEKVEITLSSLDVDLNFARRNKFIENSDNLQEKFNIFRSHTYFKEYILNKNKVEEAEILDICHKNGYGAQVKEEIKRIYAQSNGIFGVPVHYIINMDNDNAKDLSKLLIDALHSNKRIIRDKYAVLKPSDLHGDRDTILAEIETVFNTNDGGLVLIDLEEENIDSNAEFSGFYGLFKLICQVYTKSYNKTTLLLSLNSNDDKALERIKNNLGYLQFVELKNSLCDESAVNYLKQQATKFGVTCLDGLTSEVEPQKDYTLVELNEKFKIWHKNYLCTYQFPQYSSLMKVEEKKEVKELNHHGYQKLQELIGLKKVKELVNDFINYSKLQHICGNEVQFSRNMCFIGNPGTAKTTVARIIAQIMKEEGLLSKGDLIEVGRGDIVSRFLGGTAPKVKELFNRARGCVIFIDEAYSLYDGREGLYGDEAINMINQEMENNREDTIVIFAGYKREMERFLARNAGLKSRIAFEVEFPDYSDEELIEIARLYAKKLKVDISKCEEVIKKHIAGAKGKKDFGNGRFIRNLVESARVKQATRLVESDMLNLSNAFELLPEDFGEPIKTKNNFLMGFHY